MVGRLSEPSMAMVGLRMSKKTEYLEHSWILGYLLRLKERMRKL